MTILLIRHGQTDGNAQRRLQFPETPLSELGREQARRLSERLAGEKIALIVSSDYARAQATAEAVQSRNGAPLELDPLWRERSFGELRGIAYADLQVDPFAPDFVPPGGESWQALHQRADVAWESICKRAASLDGALAIVTHGLVCHSLASRRFQLEAALPEVGGFGNTSLTRINPAPPHEVSLLGCTIHLN